MAQGHMPQEHTAQERAAQPAVIGIDVGTGSARAGVFTADGIALGQASRPIRLWRPRPGLAQHATADIWAAVTDATRAALAAAGHPAIAGIGMDATCSLAVLDAAGGPVSVSPDGEPEQDVIVWMDHRATEQAERINAGGHAVLRAVGGRISPEMQTPKLLWLREHRPEAFARAAHFMDLPDWLTWRATGATSRSLCSVVCKWTFDGHAGRWDADYFRRIGLGVLADEGFARIGTAVLPMGAPVGAGLSAAAAAELGLPPGTPVGTSAIDAHAGGLGVIGAPLEHDAARGGATPGDAASAGAFPGDTASEGPAPGGAVPSGAVTGGASPGDAALGRRIALIGGTSTCHMAVSPGPRFVPGVWGPYFSAMIPGLWLNEAGQSATGSLIDHVLGTHAAFPPLAEQAARRGETIYQVLNDRLDALARGLPFPALLTAGLHVMPDFLGNRSPRADPSLRGMVSGLPLSAGPDDLAVLYLATVQAVAYGTRHIVETLNAAGYAADTLLAAGGGTKNPVFLREHADATGCTVVLPREPEAVLLGSAMLGAVAGGLHPTLRHAMAAMSEAGARIAPAGGAVARYHDAKYAVMRRMFDDQMAYRALMRAG